MAGANQGGNPSLHAEVLASVAAASSQELAEALLSEFDQLNHRFHLADYRPSELSGGRFSEAAFRICQQVCLGNYVPLGKKLPDTDTLLRDLAQVPTTAAPESYRLHIPRALRLVYDFRNKRDVAHLGQGVSPNLADASLILGIASWVVAEIVRQSHQCGIAEAQRIVDGLVQRRVPLVWEEDDVVRVLAPELRAREKVLVLLYHFHPGWVADADLARWIDYANLAQFRRTVLAPLHARALIHNAEQRSKLLPPGFRAVEGDPKLRHQR